MLALFAASIAAGLILVTEAVAIRSLAPWRSPFTVSLTPATIVASVGLALILGLLLSVWGLVSGGVKAAARRNQDRLILLTHLGATEPTLETPLRRQGFISAVVGAILGVVVAAVAGAALIWSPAVAIALAARGVTLTTLEAADLLGLAAWPAMAATVAAVAARSGARAAIRRLA